MSAVSDALGVSRPHLSAMRQPRERRRRGRPPLPDTELVSEIRALIADLPTYGYRRVHALLRRQAEQNGRAAPNAKRIYRVMKLHGLLLRRHSGRGEERRHDGRIAVVTRNTRWCSDGLEIGCENGEKVRVAFALDCCDREAMGFVATTAGITAEDIRDLMVATVEHRFGRVNRCQPPSSGSATMAVATPRMIPAASPATSDSSRAPHPSKARRATAWPRPSSERSSETMSESAPGPTLPPSYRSAANLARPLQSRASAPGTRLQIATRVYRTFNP